MHRDGRIIPPRRVPVRPRRGRVHGGPRSIPHDTAPAPSCLSMADIHLEPGGMVELALRDLGARLVAVLPDDTTSV
jgi:hypothetical protein